MTGFRVGGILLTYKNVFDFVVVVGDNNHQDGVVIVFFLFYLKRPTNLGSKLLQV